MKFTYQKETLKTPLENFEWDQTWWEQTNCKDAKRILYIGDSISCGIRPYITSLSENGLLCDGFGTSKAVDHLYFKASVQLFMEQQSSCEAILFNNGLHGWHMSTEQYAVYYEEFLQFLKGSELPIYVVLTTNVLGDQERSSRIAERNRAAICLAGQYGFPIIDLYSMSEHMTSLYEPDGVHFQKEGYRVFAREILKVLGSFEKAIIN